MEAFARAVSHYTSLDEKWREDISNDTEPLLDQFSKYWRDKLLSGPSPLKPETVEKLFADLPALLKEYPAQTDNEGIANDNVIAIQDPKAFKAALRATDDPKPLVDWPDLPAPHL